MLAETYISPVTLPLKPTDSIEQALELMTEFRVRHLPVVDENEQLLGVVSEEDLLNETDWSLLVEDVIRNIPLAIKPETHLYEAAKILREQNLSTLPIIDANRHYVGLIERKELFEAFSDMLGVQEGGAIVVIEANSRDYSPSQIAYILEQNNVKLLSLVAETTPDGLHITLKLNTTDTSRVRHVLEHYGYRIVGDFGEDETDDDLQLRAEAFLRYLEV